jgi:uncharacterized protein (TIGR00369 family)
MDLKLDAATVEHLVTGGFKADAPFFHVEELRQGFVRIRQPFRKWMQRPGEVISGPALFAAADTAMYVLVLAHIGPEMMAVTSDLSMHFLNKGKLADVIADARLLKLGRKLAVMEVSLYCGDDPTPVAHVTGTYALPGPR